MTCFKKIAATVLLSLAVGATPLSASAKSILVFGPHPDDETMVAGGRTRTAVLAGDTVNVVVVTNGDIDGKAMGLLREAESVAAAGVLGVPEQQVIFLGYGDQDMYNIWASTSGSQVFKSVAGQTVTYANRGLGGTDFHTHRTGVPGAYNRDTVMDDFKALITTYHPDEIYTVSYWDNHGDHAATAFFINEALIALKQQGVATNVRVFQSMVWPPDTGNCYGDWPPAGSGPLPYPPYPPAQCIGPGTSLDWNEIQRFGLPPEMQAPVSTTNLKWQALAAYPSQFNDFLASFIREDEFFWRYDYGTNLSATAQVSASSDFPDGQGAMAHAIDGYADVEHEWKSQELNGAWIQLNWASPVRTAQINLYDRLDLNDNVLAGTLSFSDGSTVAVGALNTVGKPKSITFPPKVVSWVRFTIDQATGYTAGLAEFEVLGVPATSSANIAPNIISGPLPSVTTIDSTQTSTLTVSAWDLDGDPLTYSWSADGGSITGNGPSAVFTPPPVAQTTLFTVTVQISDGRGGVTSNSAFITVTVGKATSGVTLSPASVAAGQNSTGTVLLSSAAPVGGTVVPLSSSNSAVAQVPASVTVPAGASSATFTINTFAVSATTQAVITATIGGQNKTATLTVTPAGPTSLTLSPASTIGGSTVQATVTLSFAAPPAGEVVTLGASDPTLVSTPATVTVPGGSTSATFSIGTSPVASASTVNLTAADAGVTVGATLTLNPLLLTGVSLNPTSVAGGVSSQGTVTLNGSSYDSSAVIQLSSSDPSASVPASVNVAAGSSTATFTVTTVLVGTTTSATITATFGGTSKTAVLTVNPPALTSLSLSPATVAAGAGSTGTVNLSGPAPAAGLSVTLSSDTPTAASVPVSVVVTGGQSSATFPIATYPVSVKKTVTISAVLSGVTKTATLTVNPLTVSSVKLTPTSVIGGTAATATVTMSGAVPAPGVQVSLSSGNAAAQVPASVTVPAGATTASFTVTTSAVAASTTAAISATYGNTKSANLTIKPPALSKLTLAPASVVGAAGSTGTITLTGPAPQGGFAVTTSSNNAAVGVPASVAVPAGALTVDFAVATSVVTAVTSVSISATAGTVTKSVTLTVTVTPAVSAIALNPSTAASGGTSLATVTINAPAPAGGLSLTTRSNNTAVATVATGVRVPEGQTTVVFSVTAKTVTATSTASISAVAGGVTKSATLTVTP
jgi:LmbE family N-acetylglucosaminyl deacetylase